MTQPPAGPTASAAGGSGTRPRPARRGAGAAWSHETVQWVKRELANSIVDARALLERFAEDREALDLMRRFANLMHTAAGALRMVDIQGATLLVEEMEVVAEGIEQGTLLSADDGLDALTRSVVQLPAYVERVAAGERDIPLLLLPLLNDLRAVRGSPLLSESTLFILNIPAETMPETFGGKATAEDISQVVRKLHPHFQVSLLGWLRGRDAERCLSRMNVVSESVIDLTRVSSLARLFWVVCAVIEALQDGGLPTGASIKRLMGQVERQLRRVVTAGEGDFEAAPAEELLSNLLYYVARAGSTGERVGAVKQAFALRELLPENEELDSARADLGGPSAELMGTVGEAIKSDLSRIKELLEQYLASGDSADSSALAGNVEQFKKIGDTLRVLGLGDLSLRIEGQRDALEALIETDRVDAEALLGVASALLEIEDALDDALESQSLSSGREEDEATGVNQEFQKVVAAVVRECNVSLGEIKEILARYSRDRRDRQNFERLGPLQRTVAAALHMLEKHEAARIARRLVTVVEGPLLNGSSPPADSDLDRLADALVGLEYYLETIGAGRPDPAYMLDNAATCLDVLAPEELLPEPASEPTASDEGGAEDVEAVRLTGAGVHVDPELLDLFLEEAREEIESINAYLPAWRDASDSPEMIVALRRSFHTLKGSGRMVGAMEIGDFAWGVEHLLNGLLNKRFSATNELRQYIDDAARALPRFVVCLEQGTAIDEPLQALIRRGAELGNLAVPEAAAPPHREDAPTSDESFDAQAPPLAQIAAEEEDSERPDSTTHLGEWEAAADAMHARRDPTESLPTLLELRDVAGDEELGDEATSGSVANPDLVVAPVHELDDAVREAIDAAVGKVGTLTTGACTSVGVAAVDPQLVEAWRCVERLASDASLEPLERLAESVWRYLETAAYEGLCLPDAAAEVLGVSAVTAERWMEDRAELHAPDSIDALDDLLEQLYDLPEPDASPQAVPEDQLGVATGNFTAPRADDSVPSEADDEVHAPAYDDTLVEIFTEEAGELLEAADSSLQQWRHKGGDSAAAVAELKRVLHTLKGGARMAGITPIGDVSHELESLLIRAGDGDDTTGDQQILDLAQSTVDSLHGMRDALLAREPLRGSAAALSKIRSAAGGGLEAEDEPEFTAPAEPLGSDDAASSASAVEQGLARAATEAASVAARATPVPPGAELAKRRETIRVGADLLDSLLNDAGEISIFRSRMEQQISSMGFNVAEFGQTVDRLRAQLRKLELETEAQILFRHQDDSSRERTNFDPLELDRYSLIQQLSRALAESVNDLGSLRDMLSSMHNESENLLVQQARATGDLQAGLMRTRMVPFSKHTQRLTRIVRQTADEQGKLTALRIDGGAGELDRHILERMLPPFEHMLRNAVVHGIESPAERHDAGKPEQAQITISLRREGAEMVISVSDDGAGLDVEAIRERGLRQGLISSDDQLSDRDLMQLIFRPGFSTASEVTQAAGRGVGMDVVASEVRKLGGTLDFESSQGQGTRFEVRLPFTLAITQALLVEAGGEGYAIPLPAVEGILRLPTPEVERHLEESGPVYEYSGTRYRFSLLGNLLGNETATLPDTTTTPVILVRAGERSTALVVDALNGNREIVVKTAGPQIAAIRGIAGATVLGDGALRLILDVGALVRGGAVRAAQAEELPPAEHHKPLALVVDDSITVRRVTSRLLERNSVRVLTARDGIDAISVMEEHLPDVLLLDIEMPRMDGYELVAHMRKQDRLRGIPIVMITSRVGEKHRAHGLALGVNDYLGKPYQEAQLLTALEPFLNRSRVGGAGAGGGA
ncbi:MAG: Hpt domain-containing protein [Pseudomonadota bacterium]